MTDHLTLLRDERHRTGELLKAFETGGLTQSAGDNLDDLKNDITNIRKACLRDTIEGLDREIARAEGGDA